MERAKISAFSMVANEKVTVERLRELLNYESRTGVFTWKVFKSPRALPGNVAGATYSNGRRAICIDGKVYGANRLAWAYMTGRWPDQEIDHINGDALDDRFENLRDVSRSVNMQNQRRPHADKKSCDLIGATWDKMWGNWKAQIGFQKKTVYLGRFKTAEEAHAAYLAGKRRLHEGCTI